MSTNCHDCGYRDNEVKSGGAISAKGRKITLKVEDTDDLSRDILKVRFTGVLSLLDNQGQGLTRSPLTSPKPPA
jgi:C4-type Zn-finger protein